MTKLLDSAGQLVDVPAGEVATAIDSGRYKFPTGRNIPIIQGGTAKWVDPNFAADYYKRLTFTDDDVVATQRAEDRTRGLGGLAAATAYGAVKSATLGAAPLFIGAGSETARDYFRDLELGRPGAVMAGEIAGLFVDPFAAGAKETAKVADVGAAKVLPPALPPGPAAPSAAAATARPALTLGAGPGRAVAPSLGARAGEVMEAQFIEDGGAAAAEASRQATMPGRAPAAGAGGIRLGGGTPPAAAAGGEGFAARDIPLGRRTLTAGEGRAATMPESPLTLQQPPFEAQLMADLRNESRNLTSRIGELDTLIAQTAQSRRRDAADATQILRQERDRLAGQLEEYEFQLTKFGPAEESALADQAARAAEGAFYGAPRATLARDVLPTAERALGAERAAAQEQVAASRAARAAEEVAAAREAEREAIRRGGAAPEFIGPEGGAAIVKLGARPGLEDVTRARGALGEQVMLGRDAAATAELRADIEAQQKLAEAAKPAEQLIEMQPPAAERGLVLAGREAEAATPAAARSTGIVPASPTQAVPTQRVGGPVLEPEPLDAGLGLGAPVAAPGGAPAAATLGLAAPVPAAPGGLSLGAGGTAVPGAGMALQGAVYSGLSQAQRQQMGLEEGGPQEIALAAALGGALPLGLSALGKGFKGAAGQVAQSIGSDGAPLGQKFTRAMERLEETQLLRTFGLNKSQIQALIGQLKDDGIGRRGARQFADFVKAEFARLEQLKADPRFVDNEVLQSIKTDGFLKFGNLKPEQRVAFSDAVRTFYGQLIEKLYEPAAGVRISNDELKQALGAIRSQAMGGVKGLGDIPMKSIQSEFDAFRRFVDDPANTHTVASLREFEKTLSDSFRQSVGANNPFTPAQRAFRDTIKDLYVSKLDQAVPGASVALREANGAYSIANKMFEGARDLEAKLAQTSPLGRDQLSQFILGAAALNSPIAAAKFLIMGAALRGFYNQRGEGALADMASKLAGNGIRAMQNPVKAGAIAAQSLINADRAILYPLNAQRLVSVTPAEYTELANSVRDMAKNREDIAKQVLTATAGLPLQKQQQVMQKFDRIFQALGDALPDNIEEPGKVSEQARRYTVFARSLLDEAYATQVMANGGPEAQIAANALKAQGEDGQKYIDTLEEELRTAINADRKAQADAQLLAAYRSIKGHSRKGGLRVGGGLGRVIHGGGLRLPKMGGSVQQMSPTQVSSAVNAFSGIGSMKR